MSPSLDMLRPARDIVVTWPKTRALADYIAELALAELNGEVINFRVSRLPKETPRRCYMVHDGAVRGYNTVLSVEHRGPAEVRRVDGWGFWPEGNYIVRSPTWYSVARPIPMGGFQGWRWVRWEGA